MILPAFVVVTAAPVNTVPRLPCDCHLITHHGTIHRSAAFHICFPFTSSIIASVSPLNMAVVRCAQLLAMEQELDGALTARKVAEEQLAAVSHQHHRLGAGSGEAAMDAMSP